MMEILGKTKGGTKTSSSVKNIYYLFSDQYTIWEDFGTSAGALDSNKWSSPLTGSDGMAALSSQASVTATNNAGDVSAEMFIGIRSTNPGLNKNGSIWVPVTDVSLFNKSSIHFKAYQHYWSSVTSNNPGAGLSLILNGTNFVIIGTNYTTHTVSKDCIVLLNQAGTAYNVYAGGVINAASVLSPITSIAVMSTISSSNQSPNFGASNFLDLFVYPRGE
jgi:hypothetical protein